MKSWWTAWPVLFLSLWIFAVGALPTVQFKGTFYGGGPIRQVFANVYLFILPEEAAYELNEYFMNGSTAEEYLCFLPFASICFLFMLWLLYMITSMIISTSNWYIKRQQKSLKIALRG